MAIIPLTDETLIEIYRCGHCHGVYMVQVGLIFGGCTVNHPPGTCCHYGERAVSEEMLSAVRRLLAREGKNPVADFDNGDSLEALQTSTISDGLQSEVGSWGQGYSVGEKG